MWQRMKKLNLKAATRAFAIVWMFVLIVVMTITNIGIDKEFNWLKWLSNSLILFGITVFGLLIGESSGVDFQKERENGLYRRMLHAYDEFRSSIDNIIIYFPLFYDWDIPKRIEHKNIEFLIRGGMNHDKAKAIVKYCSIEDLVDLKEHAIEKNIDGKIVYIKKLKEKEIKPVEMVLNGEIKFKQSGPAYYLQAYAESNGVDEWEVGEAIKEERGKSRRRNRIVRIISGTTISLVVGILTVNELMKGNDAQAWMNLVSRITNLITALFCGYLSGADDVVKQADAIENKTNILKKFKSAYEKHLFPVYDEEEAAKKEYEEYQRKLEEAKKAVIDPEVVEEEPQEPAAEEKQEIGLEPLQIEHQESEE